MVFKRAFKGLKKVGKKAVKAAGGVAKGVLSGQSPAAAIRAQVQKELMALTGQGAYRKGVAKARRTIRGRGDYEMAGGTGDIMNPRTAGEPRMKNETGSVEIKRSEYLGDILSGQLINGASAFDLQNYFVNPGLDLSSGGSSAWLAPIGSSFQQYRYKQLVYEFRTTSGNSVAAANTTLGTLIMAAAYDSSKPNFPNKQQMMDSQFAVSGAPSNNILYPVECKDSLQSLKLYDIRTNANLAPGQSQNTYDFINFQIATQGMQAAGVNLGELWCHYTVCLEKTNTNNSGLTNKTANYTWTNNITGQGTRPSAGSWLGDTTTVWVPSKGNQLTMAFDIADGYLVFPRTIQQGTFLFEFYVRGTATLGAIGANVGITAGSSTIGLQNQVVFAPNSAGQVPAYVSQSTLDSPSITYTSAYVKITGGGGDFGTGLENGIILTGGSWPTAATDCQIFISEINPNAIGNGL